jgi:hypothetical protein
MFNSCKYRTKVLIEFFENKERWVGAKIFSGVGIKKFTEPELRSKLYFILF